MQTTAIIYSSLPQTLPQSRKKAKKVYQKLHLSTASHLRTSLVELFELAKADYQSGKFQQAEESLRSLLKTVASKSAEEDHSVNVTTIKKNIRPKSARPTRTSSYPTALAFSEVDSDGEGNDVVDYEVENIVDKEEANEVASKSTIIKNTKLKTNRPTTAKPKVKSHNASPSGNSNGNF
jgi:hypothetical protein